MEYQRFSNKCQLSLRYAHIFFVSQICYCEGSQQVSQQHRWEISQKWLMRSNVCPDRGEIDDSVGGDEESFPRSIPFIWRRLNCNTWDLLPSDSNNNSWQLYCPLVSNTTMAFFSVSRLNIKGLTLSPDWCFTVLWWVFLEINNINTQQLPAITISACQCPCMSFCVLR